MDKELVAEPVPVLELEPVLDRVDELPVEFEVDAPVVEVRPCVALF